MDMSTESKAVRHTGMNRWRKQWSVDSHTQPGGENAYGTGRRGRRGSHKLRDMESHWRRPVTYSVRGGHTDQQLGWDRTLIAWRWLR